MGGFRSLVLFAGLLFLPALLFAQFNNNTSSPYSRFGVGDLQPYSFGRTVAMGGASLASRNSQQINISNPASYTALDSLVFMFEFGLNSKFANYSSDISSNNANDINFSYFALNFQITNWMAASMGLTPFSDVGYDVMVNDKIANAGDIVYRYSGEGSLSRAYLGLAVQPIENISVGANLNYLFGMLNRSSETFFLQSEDFYNNFKYESMRLRDFSLGLGIQATLPLKNNQKINFAVVLDKPKYTGFSTNLTQKILNVTVGSSTRQDSDTIKYQNQERSSIEFPTSLGFGLSYVKEHKLEINADYYMQSWSKAKFFGETNPILTDLGKFAVGAEWIPEKFSIRSYLSRIAYRAGAKYENSYLLLGSQQIKDFGITFGVGLPIYRSNSTINVSAELGRKGTKKNNLVLENYAKINLSVNLYDLWFIKRRFD